MSDAEVHFIDGIEGRLTRERLDALSVGAGSDGNPAGTMSGRVVSAEVIDSWDRESCRCSDEEYMAGLGLGTLHAGMLVDDLHKLAGGCKTGRWVCPVLDNVRRQYGR